nr:beta-ketoacyl-[acyl-carrier-protein] synthase family protein [Paenibacillus sp. MMS18-CY102]
MYREQKVSKSVSNRVVITGIGASTALGSGIEQLWCGLRAGEQPFGEPTRFSADRYRARKGAFSRMDTVKGSYLRNADPAVRLALDATSQALKDARLNKEQLSGVGLVLSTTSAGWVTGEQLYKIEGSRDSINLSNKRLMLSSQAYYAGAARAVAARFGLHGIVVTMSAACASGTMSIGYAAELIRDGVAERILAGGTDSIAEVPFAIFNSLRIVSNDLCRPFDVNRNGMMLGEGAGILVLESLDSAQKRNATIYAEVLGCGVSCDAFHMTRAKSEGLVRAMTTAISQSGIEREQIEYVNCHGTGTVANDLKEMESLSIFFGKHANCVAVNGVKSVTGHLQGTAGSLEAIVTALSLYKQQLTPTANLSEPERAFPFRFIKDSSEDIPLTYAMSNSLGFGGVNASLLLATTLADDTKSSVLEKGHSVSRDKTMYPSVVIKGWSTLIPDDSATKRFTRHGTIINLINEETPDPTYDRVASLVVKTIGEAIKYAKLELVGLDNDRFGVALESFYGSQSTGERLLSTLLSHGPRAINPNDATKNTFNAPSTFAAIKHQLRGINSTFAIGSHSGGDAIRYAFDQIRRGNAEGMVVGGYDEISEFAVEQHPLYRNGEQELSEAVSMLVLVAEKEYELSEESVIEIVGVGSCFEPVGSFNSFETVLRKSLQSACQQAGIHQLDVLRSICTHPNGMSLSKQIEGETAVLAQFGLERSNIPIWDSSERLRGHTWGASASLTLIEASERLRAGGSDERLVWCYSASNRGAVNSFLLRHSLRGVR